MKIHALALVTLALFTAAFAQAENYGFKEAFSRTGSFSSTGKISLDNINGDIVIETWEKNEILIEGEKSAKTEEELKRIELTIDLSDTQAEIKVRLPKQSGGILPGKNIRGAVTFKLKVPATASLQTIHSVNSSVDVAGLRGEARIKTVNGQIRAHRLGGETHLETVNGSIDTSFSALAAEQDLSFETVNGSIKVILPEDSGFKLHTSVVNGRVDCDFPLQGPGSEKRKRREGTVGDGRAEVQAKSVNGSVRIAKG